MKRFSFKASLALVFVLAVVLAAGPALSEKPPWAGGGKNKESGKGGPPEKYDREPAGKDGRQGQPKAAPGQGPHEKHSYFTDHQREVVHSYYAAQYRKGKCPPGLAKKHNGCMPPGQAKKWAIGQPLPKGVVYYSLPQTVLVELGPPPPHHKYVRVAQDILLLATGTGMVVDAIDNLSWEFSR
jgi:Ni/Co efflux regulator RcnB